MNLEGHGIQDHGETIRDLNRRLTAIELDGSPHMRERMIRVETQMQHLLDPQDGIYPALAQNAARFRNWAIALMTAVIISMGLLLFDILTGPGRPL